MHSRGADRGPGAGAHRTGPDHPDHPGESCHSEHHHPNGDLRPGSRHRHRDDFRRTGSHRSEGRPNGSHGNGDRRHRPSASRRRGRTGGRPNEGLRSAGHRSGVRRSGGRSSGGCRRWSGRGDGGRRLGRRPVWPPSNTTDLGPPNRMPPPRGGKRERPPSEDGGLPKKSGGDLLSQGISPQVPSALEGLTSVFGMGTGVTLPPSPPKPWLSKARTPKGTLLFEHSIASTNIFVDPSPRPISTGRLNMLPCVHLRPINVIVCHGPYLVDPVGNLILERASHLDAFSAYPFRRSLTSRALGRTTGTRELRPSRSSRTRDSLPQVSSGCRG